MKLERLPFKDKCVKCVPCWPHGWSYWANLIEDSEDSFTKDHQTTNDILYLLFLHTRFTYFVHLSTATSSFSPSLSLLFVHTELKLPIDSVQISALYIFAGELSASNSSHPCRYKEANVILAPMNLGMRTVENSENENREPLIFFLKKSNTPRHWQVSNRSTKSCEKGIQVAANSVVMSRTLQKRTQVFWLLWLLVVFVTSSPNVSKEVASVAASEPPRPRAARAASVQATLKDIAFKALMLKLLRRLEQFKFSSQIGTYRGPGGPASGERENEWFKMI